MRFGAFYVLVLAGLGIAMPTSAGGQDAPFGLEWGMSIEEVEELGVTLSKSEEGKYGTQYDATNLPKVLSDVRLVTLYFSAGDLWRVSAVSDVFQNDPYGSSVKSRYEELRGLLEKKYGHGKRHHHVGDLWDEADQFLMGIRSGRNWHYTNFKNGDVFVQINVSALGSSDGVYVLIYENQNMKKDVEKRRKASEKDAL